MRTFEIEITDDNLESILIQELRNTKEMLESDLETGGIAVFEIDPKKDKKELKKHIKAINLILNYYGYYDEAE